MASEYQEVLYEWVTLGLAGIAAILNGIEIACILRSRKRNMSHGGRGIPCMSIYYTLHLSLSDFIASIIMIILKAMHQYLGTTLKDNSTAEEVYLLLRFVGIRLVLFNSILSLIASTLDRVISVLRPFAYRCRSRQLCITICIILWCLSIVICTTFYLASRLFANNSSGRYTNLIFTVSVFLAVVLFFICYSIIFWKLQSPTRTTREMKVYGKGSTEAKYRRNVLINTCLFCVCWIPLATSCLCQAVSPGSVSKHVFSTFFTLAYSTTVINPLFYLVKARKTFSTGSFNFCRSEYSNTPRTRTFTIELQPVEIVSLRHCTS